MPFLSAVIASLPTPGAAATPASKTAETSQRLYPQTTGSPARAVNGTGITLGKAVNAVVLSGARRHVLSGASPSCYQAHELRCRPRLAGLPASLNLTNLKALTCYWGSAYVWTGADQGSLAGGPAMIVALLNQKGGVGKTPRPPISPANWPCAGRTSSCSMPTRRAQHWTGRSGAASRACPGCPAPSVWRARRCTRKPRSWLVVPIM